LAALLEDDGADDEAETMYERAIEQGNEEALIDLAVFHAERGDREAARAAFDAALDSGVPEAANGLGYWLSEEGHTSEAERIYREALDRGDVSVFRNLGNLLADDPARHEQALPMYVAAIASGDKQALTNAGMLLAELGRQSEAETLLAQAAAADDHMAKDLLEEMRGRHGIAAREDSGSEETTNDPPIDP
jgi:Tfp pilus assembly protein PilF